MPTPTRNEIYDAVIRRMVTEALASQEDAFAQTHSQDSDEQLLDYLRHCAEELGHSPGYKEVIGWRLLEQRFGSWREALQKAGLSPAEPCPVTKLPRIIEITQQQKEEYRRKKADKKRRAQRRRREQCRKTEQSGAAAHCL